MVSKIFGYCRVSTKEQNIIPQVESLVENGVPEENIFQEKMSGKMLSDHNFFFFSNNFEKETTLSLPTFLGFLEVQKIS